MKFIKHWSPYDCRNDVLAIYITIISVGGNEEHVRVSVNDDE